MHFLLLLLLSVSTWAKPSLTPSLDEFREICRSRRSESLDFTIRAPEKGMHDFFPVAALDGTQNFFSHARFTHSLGKAIAEEGQALSHDDKKSMYGFNKKIKAVFYRGRLHIVDGHHRALISIYWGAKTLPVEILDVFPDRLSPRAFRRIMTRRGWGKWRDAFGQVLTPVDLCDMENDPNLQFARLVIRRVSVALQSGRLTIKKSKGAKIAIAIKINSDVPFFEFLIADALTRAGFVFDDRRTEEDLSFEELERALEILQADARLDSSPLKQLLLLDRPQDVAKHLEEIVFTHLREKACEHQLGGHRP